jgi:hypothetical protein
MVSANTLTGPTRSVDFGVVVVTSSRDGTRSDGVSTSGGRVGGTGRGSSRPGGGVVIVVLSESEDHGGCLSRLV